MTTEEPSSELDALVHETIGAAIEVHRALGPGFLESIYEEALCLELTHRKISFGRQVPIPICYRSRPVGTSQLDLLVAGQLVVELKAVPQLLPIHVAQVIFYLKGPTSRWACYSTSTSRFYKPASSASSSRPRRPGLTVETTRAEAPPGT